MRTYEFYKCRIPDIGKIVNLISDMADSDTFRPITLLTDIWPREWVCVYRYKMKNHQGRFPLARNEIAEKLLAIPQQFLASPAIMDPLPRTYVNVACKSLFCSWMISLYCGKTAVLRIRIFSSIFFRILIQPNNLITEDFCSSWTATIKLPEKLKKLFK
jgi:hypothetical protein